MEGIIIFNLIILKAEQGRQGLHVVR